MTLALAVLLIPAAASAQDRFETSRSFAVELKGGPYLPDVDSEFDGAATPYRDVFGDGSLTHLGLEFDWQVLVTDFLSLGVGALAGFFEATGKSRIEGCVGPASDCRSSDETNLSVVPLGVQAILRVDALPNLAGVPLAPFGKVGVDRWMWWVGDGDGRANEEGSTGSGWTSGWHAAAGLMLLLDFFEPGAARKLDQESGINNSYLFGEILLAEIDGLGDGESLILSDTTWNLGLCLEF
jgi:hypothetical protein